MSGKFAGKTVLITGAASGIGRATAIKLAAEGASLMLCDINEGALVQVTSQLPTEKAEYFRCNVGASAECEAAVKSAVSKFGGLDFVFNCAGINPTALPITETTDEYFDKLVNTNLRGPYNITRAAVPHLKSGAAIVNVSSMAGIRATNGFSIYCATKFGVIGFTKAMALELGPKGIRVNAVAPGPIDTPTMAGNVAGGDANERLVADIALGRLGQPEEVADAVIFLFSEESRFMNGSVVEVSGGSR
ncbi:short-chain dehydrogenase/reductase-like protein SDR [Pestalotiopsis sp. NC0098]|nr:short-chain dehydrogenase/reductase-like protein SDR [Pestalotiopsis sp. NC0098]